MSGAYSTVKPPTIAARNAVRLRELIVGGRRSPYDARETLVREFPDGRVPCLRTIYSHINAGDIGNSIHRRTLK